MIEPPHRASKRVARHDSSPRDGSYNAAHGIPLRKKMTAPHVGAARALTLMGMDKKVLAGRIRLVLLQGLGTAAVTADYDPEALGETLREHFEAGAA